MELGYFGKLPSRADFVRYNATNPVFRTFDEWIQNGLRFSTSGRFPDFDRTYAQAGASGFLYDPPGGREALLGVIRPSRDQAGRKYPFFVASVIDHVGSLDSYGYLLDHSAELVAGAIEGSISTDQLTDRIQNSNIQTDPGTAGSNVNNTTLGTLCEQLWGSFLDSHKYAAFKNLLDVLQPLRGRGQPSFSYGLRFPIASGDLRKTSVQFWINMCSALLGLSEFRSSMFWSLDDGGGGGSSGSFLSVFFSTLPPAGFLGVAHLEADIDELYTIDALNNRNPADLALSIPEQYGRLIESENLILAEVTNGFRAST